MNNNSNPQILILSLAYSPFIGGAEIAVSEITKRLGQDFEFDLITCNLDGKQKNEEQVDNVKIYRIGNGKISKIFFPFLAYAKAKKLHQKNNYSIVWSIMANQAGLATLFVKKRFSKIKFLLTLQEGDSVFSIWKKTWYLRPLYKSIYRSADHIQAISTYLANRALKYGYGGRVDVVPNGVDINKFSISNLQFTKEDLKKKLNIESDKKIIFTTSRLVEKNDIKSLIQSIKILITDHNKQIVLLIAGVGELEKELKVLTKKLNLETNIIFLGNISQDILPAYYSLADVFVRPSLSEGQGISFIEALAMCIPVIATPVGGIPDFLKAGETGWFCEPKNPQSIAEKINYILDEKNKDEVAVVVAKAKQMVEEKYNWNLIAEKMKNIFNKLKN